MTIEDLQAEVEKLRTKNAQLLHEKKQVTGERDQLKEQVEAVTGERDESARELQRITVAQPRLDMVEEKAAPGMAGPLWREINHHFDVVSVEGRDMLQHKDGSPVTIAGKDETTGEEVQKPVAFDPAGLDTLYDAGLVPGIGSMILGSQASGGGAPGSAGSGTVNQHKTNPPAKGAGFGFR